MSIALELDSKADVYKRQDTILIAELIPAWIIRIVASTDSVDIQALHNLDILNHALQDVYKRQASTLAFSVAASSSMPSFMY